MARYIDADALFEPNESTDEVLVFGRSGGKTIALAKRLMREWVNTAPTLTLDDLRSKGRWVDNGIPDSVLRKCTACGIEWGSSGFSYCPNCGADMRGGEG